MKLQILSDLHLEFHKDYGKTFFDEVIPVIGDVIILAGDICTYNIMDASIPIIKDHFGNRPIVYVAGNHEMWHSSYKEVHAKLASYKSSTFHPLEKSSVTIDGKTFHGGTLFFQHSGKPEREDSNMGDFQEIRDIYSFIGKIGQQTVEYFENNSEYGDIIVTHHLPHERSISPYFKNHPLNKYFVNRMAESLLEKSIVELWAHGHTHGSCDYQVNQFTRVICNPYGYQGYNLNLDFDPNLIVEI